ncbi:hypothetical protein [Pleionea mediterranea]|uniref:Uncharacterized protein n=1 Tax=Pleionea mediterranea TaxID=523701 RepID=A0A316FYB0_9GAMM|nr:hypothetical protein [Pleionea mediterranea]PWK53651.1 hypothetical protein C8D97_10239 [Pleionea mediterranea]
MIQSNDAYSDNDKLLALYKQVSNEQPDQDINKQIAAAAHRSSLEVSKDETTNRGENAANVWKNSSIWRYMRLPVSFMGALVMTVTLAHVMWPMINPSADSAISEASKQSAQQRITDIQLSVQQLLQADDVDRDTDPSETMALTDVQDTSLRVPEQLMPGNEPILALSNTDSEANITQRDRWITRILLMAEQGDFHEMNTELQQFTKQYPEYPIGALVRPYLK